MSSKQNDESGDGAGRACKGEAHATRSLYNHEQFDIHEFPQIHALSRSGNSIDVLSVPCSRFFLLFTSDSDFLRDDNSREVGGDNTFFCTDLGETLCQSQNIGKHYAD